MKNDGPATLPSGPFSRRQGFYEAVIIGVGLSLVLSGFYWAPYLTGSGSSTGGGGPTRTDFCGPVNGTGYRANCAGATLPIPYNESGSSGPENRTIVWVNSGPDGGILWANYSQTGDIQVVVGPESLLAGLWVHYDWDYVVDNGIWYAGNLHGSILVNAQLPAGGEYELFYWAPPGAAGEVTWSTDTAFTSP